jgi:hypothetical protein
MLRLLSTRILTNWVLPQLPDQLFPGPLVGLIVSECVFLESRRWPTNRMD